MVNNFWALRRELTQNNGSSRPAQPDSQTRNNHQSTNGYLTTPQSMMQRPQNHHLMDVNNQTTNGFTHPVQHDVQTHSNHQSTNGYLTTPQIMLQRPQNHLMGVNNFNQGINLIINVFYFWYKLMSFFKLHILKIKICVSDNNPP
jgi:hypothetical protein